MPEASAVAGIVRFRTEHQIPTPELTTTQRTRLYALAEDAGLTRAQLVENAGGNAARMLFSVLGGARRINPRNAAQIPQVIVLAGSGPDSAAGICTARHMANHNLRVTVFIAPEDQVELSAVGLVQLKLFSEAGGKVIRSADSMPSSAVDLVLDAVGVAHCGSKTTAVLQWCKQHRIRVASFGVPAGVDIDTGARAEYALTPTWCISFGLPGAGDGFTSACDQFYLVDLGIPKSVYKKLIPNYHSPFYESSVVPLERF